MLFDDHFRDLLYNKHRLALRILYVYSALCSICRFQFLMNVMYGKIILLGTGLCC